jgi:hypothetical protein
MLGLPRCASGWTPPEPRTAANSVMGCGRPEAEWRISERPKEGATFGLSHTTHRPVGRAGTATNRREGSPVSLIWIKNECFCGAPRGVIARASRS